MQPLVPRSAEDVRNRCIWGKELHDLLMAFPPPHLAYLAASRLLTRLRRMRAILPIWNTSSVLLVLLGNGLGHSGIYFSGT